MTNYKGHYYNIVTLLAERMHFLQHKSCLVIWCRISYQLIITPSFQSGSVLLQLQSNSDVTTGNRPLLTTISIPTHCQTLPLDRLLLFKTPKQKSGTSMASLQRSPQKCHYFVKTKGGRVSVRNRHFLHCRVPASIPDNTLPSHTSPPSPEKIPLWWSSHTIHPIRRLTEDPTWNWC